MGARAAPVASRYEYNGTTYQSERSMLLPLLDGFRAAEAFGAELLNVWLEICEDPQIRGGLKTICRREAAHASLLEQRLTELGGTCRAAIPEAARQGGLTALASRDVSDLEKLQGAVAQLANDGDVTGRLRRTAEQLTDIETRELLLTILDDEDATTRWLHRTCKEMS